MGQLSSGPRDSEHGPDLAAALLRVAILYLAASLAGICVVRGHAPGQGEALGSPPRGDERITARLRQARPDDAVNRHGMDACGRPQDLALPGSRSLAHTPSGAS
jgi:hypothetical protein